VKALLEFVWVRRSFLSSSSVECRSSARILRISIETNSQVPLVYQDFGLLGYLQHYLEVCDLLIIVSHSFTSLMVFVHLCTV
jgi:hypothetical protein